MSMGKTRIREGDMVRLKTGHLFEISPPGISCWESKQHIVYDGTLALVVRVGPCECGSSKCVSPIRFTVILDGKRFYAQRYNMSRVWTSEEQQDVQ
jgi:hypothetical protein